MWRQDDPHSCIAQDHQGSVKGSVTVNQPYRDIIERLGTPDWWDEAGVPRYGEFHPDMCNSIYGGEAALMKIACQNCGTEFKVAVKPNTPWEPDSAISDRARDGGLVPYGDPPNTGCCPEGPTMSSLSVDYISYWERSSETGWEWLEADIDFYWGRGYDDHDEEE